jgi:hypothetical protein
LNLTGFWLLPQNPALSCIRPVKTSPSAVIPTTPASCRTYSVLASLSFTNIVFDFVQSQIARRCRLASPPLPFPQHQARSLLFIRDLPAFYFFGGI